MYRRTETPLQLIQPAGWGCICVWDSEHLLLSASTVSLHLVPLWSNLSKRKKMAKEAPQSEDHSASRMWKRPKTFYLCCLWWRNSGCGQLLERGWRRSAACGPSRLCPPRKWFRWSESQAQKHLQSANRDVGCPLNYTQLPSHVQTYLPRHGRLTHEDLIVGSELWRVVVHVFDSDVNTDFGVLVMAACTQTRMSR